MVFKRFVEVGRVALINFGLDYGKICVIIDIIDQNKVIVDGPLKHTGVSRQIINVKRLSLTDLVVDKLKRNSRQITLIKNFEKSKVLEKWNQTAWAKKLAKRKAKLNETDFDKFTHMVEKRKKKMKQ